MTEHPVTYQEAMDLSLPDQIARYEELTDRNLMASCPICKGKSRASVASSRG